MQVPVSKMTLCRSKYKHCNAHIQWEAKFNSRGDFGQLTENKIICFFRQKYHEHKNLIK